MRSTVIVAFLALICGCGIRHPEVYLRAAIAKKPYDAVIVPGVPFNNGEWDGTMNMRVHWAVLLYEQGITKHIIFSGSSVYSPYVEARIMSLYAQKLGVPQDAIALEPRAEHSTENLYYGWKKAKELGWRKVALATDDFQTGTLKGFARKMKRKVGAEVDLIPVVEDSMTVERRSTPVIDPSSAFVSPFTSLVDRQSLWHRLGGTMGKHINWKEP